MEDREMYAEMTLLVSAMARELNISVEDAVKGIETGELSVTMGAEANGERFLALAYQGKTARILQSALGMGSSCGGCCGGAEEDCDEPGCGTGGCCG